MFKEVFNLLNDLLSDKTLKLPVPLSSKSAKLIESVSSQTDTRYWHSVKLKDFESGREILESDPAEQADIVLELLDWLSAFETKLNKKLARATSYAFDYTGWQMRILAIELLRKKLTFTEEKLIRLLDWATLYDKGYWRGMPQIIKQIQDFQKSNQLSPNLVEKIKDYLKITLLRDFSDAQKRQSINKLREIVGLSNQVPLVAGEIWADSVIEEIGELPETEKENWIVLLNHCAAAAGSTPTAKWLKTADSLIEEIGCETFRRAVLKWFPLVDKPRTQRLEPANEWMPDPNLLLDDQNADVLKGLIWLCTKREDREIFRALTALAISAYRKVPRTGPRCVRVGNACVWALGEMRDPVAVGQLALLKVRVKFGTAQKLIETALEKAAQRAGLSKEEIEEMSVPAYGLQEVGRMMEKIGAYTAEVTVRSTDEVALRWLSPDGKLLKSVPASLKKDHAEDLKELNQTVKDIRQMLPAQRNRIDCLYLEQKNWSFEAWRERYLDHPLVGTIARRLIWKFSAENGNVASGIWLDGRIVSAENEALDFLNESVRVELWHPLDETVEGVLAWREFLEEHLIRQPFKQAHREIYLLTDAEQGTRVYSNRFAAHILKQHQFNALCAARNWKNKLRLMVDADFPPATRPLPKWNLRAEFWIEGAGENYGTDTNETGTYLYLTTDQVRFYPIEARENFAHAGGGGYALDHLGVANPVDPVELEQIPPLVFSEIMRDVDLFVGVASVGNDPNWMDSGRDGARGNYWYEYSFGELSVSAIMRKQMLEKIIPRLKIADRCRFEDKFLVVRGDLRTYKIHLGSANILMEPNDQYLCIVTSQGAVDPGKVFLPFEGDQRTAVILSKAFLLAEDTKIKDPTIVRQIK